MVELANEGISELESRILCKVQIVLTIYFEGHVEAALKFRRDLMCTCLEHSELC